MFLIQDKATYYKNPTGISNELSYMYVHVFTWKTHIFIGLTYYLFERPVIYLAWLHVLINLSILHWFYLSSQRVQINFIFNDNVRILCLSCNIKSSKTPAKLSENCRTKRILSVFKSAMCDVSAYIVTVPFCCSTGICSYYGNRCFWFKIKLPIIKTQLELAMSCPICMYILSVFKSAMCDVSAYIVTVPFCCSTGIGYQNSYILVSDHK
jgi:hypothetical protein